MCVCVTGKGGDVSLIFLSVYYSDIHFDVKKQSVHLSSTTPLHHHPTYTWPKLVIYSVVGHAIELEEHTFFFELAYERELFLASI